MAFHLARNRRLTKELTRFQASFLERCVNSLTEILPHIEATKWKISDYQESRVKWLDSHLLQLDVTIGLNIGQGYSIEFAVRRKQIPNVAAAVARRLDLRERAICEALVDLVDDAFGDQANPSSTVVSALSEAFQELVVANYLRAYHELQFDPEALFREFRVLAEQTYENHALTFGCIIDPDVEGPERDGFSFPGGFLAKKRYRALSDGYRTAYVISKYGKFTQFAALPRSTESPPSRSYIPEWCRDMAMRCRHGRVGVLLTRHGDILVLEAGTLRLTYRSGRWQYWNHTHLIELLRDSARAQRVPPEIVGSVVNRLYRLALDASFRRTGALFVLLRNRQMVTDLVRAADQISHDSRQELDSAFDGALGRLKIEQLPRAVLVELAAIDGAVVVNNHGEIMAYGAVLDPKRKGRADAEEGSRTKAAIGASNYGLALKVSADGEIVAYREGRELISV